MHVLENEVNAQVLQVARKHHRGLDSLLSELGYAAGASRIMPRYLDDAFLMPGTPISEEAIPDATPPEGPDISPRPVGVASARAMIESRPSR